MPAMKRNSAFGRLQPPMERRKIKSTEVDKPTKRFAVDEKADRGLAETAKALRFSANNVSLPPRGIKPAC
jgi:hypothetical protein